MAEHGIVVDGVWKKFHKGEVHDSLRDLVPAMAKRLVGRGPKRDRLDEGDFWALRDVSFDVKPGEALGIIGPNGAGKSTMLKILNRILRPNRGAMDIKGRVGALIEIAAGFHPDLTGRENLYLQGAISGMKRAEIVRKFDAIVEFSGISDFIDTPVKRYSSGMNARLGFSIAAHLDPDVLLIDEVLAVGDWQFQARAFEHLHRLVKSGIPVIIVTHQLQRVVSLCNRALLLDQGSVVFEGNPSDCVAKYISGNATPSEDARFNSPYQINQVELPDGSTVESGARLRILIHTQRTCECSVDGEGIVVRVKSPATGEALFVVSNEVLKMELPEERDFVVDMSLQMNLPDGSYLIESVVRNTRHTDVHRGPIAMANVRGHGAEGSVQLNPSMKVL